MIIACRDIYCGRCYISTVSKGKEEKKSDILDCAINHVCCGLRNHQGPKNYCVSGQHAETKKQILRIFMCQLLRVCSYQYLGVGHFNRNIVADRDLPYNYRDGGQR